MSDLKNAILDAKYIDMISLGDFVVRDCGLPDVDEDGNLMPQANEIAAALFRWAASMEADGNLASLTPRAGGEDPADVFDDAPEATPEANSADTVNEYDEFGDPVMDAEEAERRASAAANGAQESS